MGIALSIIQLLVPQTEVCAGRGLYFELRAGVKYRDQKIGPAWDEPGREHA
jgi:hypothetical protein